MDIKSLQIFVTLVETQSFTVAAEQLNLTQPTISKAMRALEEQLGVMLLHKGEAGRKRGVTLTYVGQQVYEHALIILNEQQRIFDTVTQVRGLKKGKLTIGLPPLAAMMLSTVIAKFHSQYPHIELNFLEVGATGIEEAILRKEVDAGVVMGDLKPLLSGFEIINSPICLLAKKNSHWRKKSQIKLIELQEESFLLYANTFTLNNVIIQAAQSVGFEPKVACRSSQWDFIAKLVESNVGIALLPQAYCERLNSEEFHIALLTEPNINWNLKMAWNSSVAMTPATRAWLNIIQDNLESIHF